MLSHYFTTSRSHALQLFDQFECVTMSNHHFVDGHDPHSIIIKVSDREKSTNLTIEDVVDLILNRSDRTFTINLDHMSQTEIIDQLNQYTDILFDLATTHVEFKIIINRIGVIKSIIRAIENQTDQYLVVRPANQDQFTFESSATHYINFKDIIENTNNVVYVNHLLKNGLITHVDIGKFLNKFKLSVTCTEPQLIGVLVTINETDLVKSLQRKFNRIVSDFKRLFFVNHDHRTQNFVLISKNRHMLVTENTSSHYHRLDTISLDSLVDYSIRDVEIDTSTVVSFRLKDDSSITTTLS